MLGESATGGLGIGVVCYNSRLRAEAVRLSRFGPTVLFTGKEKVEASVVNVIELSALISQTKSIQSPSGKPKPRITKSIPPN